VTPPRATACAASGCHKPRRGFVPTTGKLISRPGVPPIENKGAHAIDTLDDLRRHLQWAIELEHATIPPYMYALYSLDPASNAEAAQVLGTVLIGEMLHLTLAANLLKAVGGSPVLDAPELLPPCPHPLPHGD
jgi:hypothetical protein